MSILDVITPKSKGKAEQKPGTSPSINDDPRVSYLGKECRDVLSGVEGLCGLVLHQPNGNWMIEVQPKVKEVGGVRPDGYIFDRNIVDVIGDGISNRVVKTGDALYENGQKVKDKLSGFVGTINGIYYYTNGCIHYSLVGVERDIESGKAVSEIMSEERLGLFGKQPAKAAPAATAEAAPAPKPRGGPAMRSPVRG